MGTEIGVEKHFKWLELLRGEEKQQALQTADLFILPSDEEPFGIVILEAMAHGKPVIGTDTVGSSEIIKDGETGFMVQRGNIDQIASASLKLLMDSSLRTSKGEKARKTAEKQYSVSRVVDQIEEMYYQLLASKS